MIVVALALALSIEPCSRPKIEPVTYARPSDPQYEAMTHIRRLKDVCLPEMEAPGLVAMSEPESFEGETPYPMPTEGMWAMPYSEPYCECIGGLSARNDSGGLSGGNDNSPPGYVYGDMGNFPGIVQRFVQVPAVPEPAEWALMLAGLGLLWRRKC